MTNIWESPGEETTFVAAAKGAPEAIGRLCRLDKEGQARLEAAATAMAVRGMRVLGVAAGRVPREVAAKDHLEHDFELLGLRSEEHTSELQSLMRISYAVFC